MNISGQDIGSLRLHQILDLITNALGQRQRHQLAQKRFSLVVLHVGVDLLEAQEEVGAGGMALEEGDGEGRGLPVVELMRLGFGLDEELQNLDV
jgi:hypothetical protein